MPIAKEFLSEFEIQAPLTRKYLERVPESKLTWKPHEKSMTLGQLAYHLAMVPSGIAKLVSVNPAPAPEKFEFPQPASVAKILKTGVPLAGGMGRFRIGFVEVTNHRVHRCVQAVEVESVDADPRSVCGQP